MRLLHGLIFSAALAAALPEPAAPTPKSCSQLQSSCKKAAKSYCRKMMTPTETVEGSAATVSAFPSDYPCQAQSNAKAKRAHPPDYIPKCYRQEIKTGGSAALTSACSCLGITPGTTTVAASTVYATKFVVQVTSGGPYAKETSGPDFAGVAAVFDSDIAGAERYHFVEVSRGQCQLVDSQGRIGSVNADRSVRVDDMRWDSAANIPSENQPTFHCGFNEPNTMQCLINSNLNFDIDGNNGAWQMQGDYTDTSSTQVVVTPVVD